jgi:hypothetical protein
VKPLPTGASGLERKSSTHSAKSLMAIAPTARSAQARSRQAGAAQAPARGLARFLRLAIYYPKHWRTLQDGYPKF